MIVEDSKAGDLFITLGAGNVKNAGLLALDLLKKKDMGK